jgi:hypothetical protein
MTSFKIVHQLQGDFKIWSGAFQLSFASALAHLMLAMLLHQNGMATSVGHSGWNPKPT